jgi:two-component system response regulator HydG
MKEVREGRFREDLFYRLNVVAIKTPPLRAMRTEIPALAMHFLRRFAAENDKTLIGFDDAALALLDRHLWPGNVRELENAIERCVLMCRNELVGAADLALAAAPIAEVSNPSVSVQPDIPGATLADVERYALLRTLEHTGGSTAKAAAILGISLRKLQYRLQVYMERSAALP